MTDLRGFYGRIYLNLDSGISGIRFRYNWNYLIYTFAVYDVDTVRGVGDRCQSETIIERTLVNRSYGIGDGNRRQSVATGKRGMANISDGISCFGISYRRGYVLIHKETINVRT